MYYLGNFNLKREIVLYIMENISITNTKILDFYSQNPTINFEAVNLIFVDLFERLLGDMNSAMNSTINSQILSTVGIIKNDICSLSSSVSKNNDDLKTDVNALSSSVSKINQDLTNSIFLKFQESKREYIEDLTQIISNNFSHNSDKIQSLLQQNTSQIIDKATLLLNEVIPKSNDVYYKQINDSISQFHKSISDDTTKLLESTDKDKSLSIFMANFETKSNNMIQPILSCLNSTEERINQKICSNKEDSTNMLQPILTCMNASEERINQNVISLKNDSQASVQEKIMTELSEFLGKYKNSSYKGQFGENQLETVLTQLFPSGEVLNTTGQRAACDFRVNRTSNPSILVETKNYDRNVTLDEVKKFIRDIEEQKCHGIFLSQHSGITSKQNFQIDIKGTNILVYVHNVDYCPHIIKIATDIIDSLSYKLEDLEENPDEISIPKETIDEINKEYSRFIERKSNIIDILKDFHKRITSEVDEIKFPSLSKYLASKCGSILNNDHETIICNICNTFEAPNNKSLSAHKRSCKKKYCNSSIDSNIVIDTKP
jgi:hypothetical protein